MRSFTFFESAKISDPFARIGDDKGRCPCAAGLQNNCIGHSISVNNTCNCDSSNTTELFDEGIMKDDLGAITKMTFLQFPDRDSVGKMTLSDLTCGGSSNRIITFILSHFFSSLSRYTNAIVAQFVLPRVLNFRFTTS